MWQASSSVGISRRVGTAHSSPYRVCPKKEGSAVIAFFANSLVLDLSDAVRRSEDMMGEPNRYKIHVSNRCTLALRVPSA